MRSKTTTYDKRNTDAIDAAFESHKSQNPDVLEIGAGLATKKIPQEGITGPSKKAYWSRFFDKFARTFPLSPSFFENFETEEILEHISPNQLTVLDVDYRVLKVIQKKHRNISIQCHNIAEEIDGMYDIILCFHTICRIDPKKRKQTMKNITTSLNSNGILAVTKKENDLAELDNSLTIIGPGLYRKT